MKELKPIENDGADALMEALAGPASMLAALVIGWAAISIILGWQLVGFWRSATRHAPGQSAPDMTRLWVAMAQLLAVVSVLQMASLFGRFGAPQIAAFYQIAFLGDPAIPNGTFDVLPGGKELSFSGGIKFGTAAELQRILKTAPQIRVLHLSSDGGRMQEARKLFLLVAQYKLETYVSNECSSACALVFAAGARRWLSDAGRLGFHGATAAGLTSKELHEANEDWASEYRKAGIDAAFINKALAVPPDELWFPTVDELIGARVVTDIEQGEHFLPSGHEAVPTLIEIEATVRRKDRRVNALHELSPDLAREIYVKIRQVMIAGTLSDDTLHRIDWAIEVSAMAYLSLADDEVIREFAVLGAERYSTLSRLGGTACLEYNRSGSFPKEAMTDEIRIWTDDVYEMILRTAKERPVPDPAMVEAALTNVILGMSEELVTLFLDSTHEVRPEEYEAFCRGGIAFFESVARLPTAQMAAIMRELYRVPRR